MLIFHKIKYKNFLSIGNNPIEIELDKSKTSLVTGKNGSGKSSSITDTITFALFGKPFRNITKPGLLNSINLKELEVELDFSVGSKSYKIIRGMKPNKFEIYENGILLNQDAANKDYQDYLETNILHGLNEKVFRQIVVIGAADFKPFMQLSTSQRREIVEELLDIKIFSTMSTITKQHLATIKEDMKNIEFSLKLTEEKLVIHRKNLVTLESSMSTEEQEKSSKIKSLQDLVTKAETLLKDYETKLTKIREPLKQKQALLDTLDKLKALKSNLEISKKTTEKTLLFFTQSCDCPTCTQTIDEDFKQQMTDASSSKLIEIDQAILKTSSNLQTKQDLMLKLKQQEELEQRLLSEQVKVKTKLELAQKELTQLTCGISKTISQVKDLQDTIKAEEHILATTKTSYVDLIEKRKYFDIALELFKDSGIKTKIIRQYIPLLNKNINDYLQRFGLPIEFTFDEQFNEVIKSRYRDTFVYNNFSEGEKQRINMSLLLAWRAMAKTKNTVNTNLLVLDETMDGHLDATATEELLNILLGLGEKTNIYIISHKQDLSDKLDKVYHFEKNGNFSTMKEYVTT